MNATPQPREPHTSMGPRVTRTGHDTPSAADWRETLVFTSQLFDMAPIGLAVFDSELRMLQANQALADIVGKTVDRMIGGYAPELVPEADPAVWDLARTVLATGKPVTDVEVVSASRPSWPELRTWRISHYPIRDSDGTTVAVGQTTVDITERRQAEAERDAVERRLLLLSRASGLIGASLDLSATLEGLVELVVPEFTDDCVIMLADEPLKADARPDRLVLHTTVWTDPSGAFSRVDSSASRTRLVTFDRNTPAYISLSTGRPVRADMYKEMRQCLERITGAWEYVTRVGIRCGICAPLLTGGEFYGVIHFGLGVSGRSYGEQDLQTAAELGNRVASALANSRAYTRQRQAALTLQRGLLPGDLPAVEDLELAWRYEPGRPPDRSVHDPLAPPARTDVGGDWFDVIPLSAGRVGFVIGDVMGRGLTAAAVMGQLRTAVRAFAALDLPAADTLTHLDELVQTIGTGPDGALVSCVYAIWEPSAGTICLANAGHLSPALVRSDGTAQLLSSPDGMILGVGGQSFTETRHLFPPGATLVLYTDGLVESPAVGIEEGCRRLLDTLTHTDTLNETANRLLTLIDRTDGYDDDVALLLVHASAPHPADTRTLVVNPEPQAAKTARDTVNAALEDWGLPGVAFTVELLVSELVTNAIRYAETTSELVLRRGSNAIYVEVSDCDTRVPRLLQPTAEDEGGRGLQLVAELATQWGARPTRTGKTVWFQVDLTTA